MTKRFLVAAASACTLLACPAYAATLMGSYSVTVSEGLTNGSGIDAATASAFTGDNTASATFTYTGALNFDNVVTGTTTRSGDLNSDFFTDPSAISGYNGSGRVSYNGNNVANYNNKGNFLGSSASTGNYGYASLYTIDLGTLASGMTLTIRHDDGIALFQNGNRIGTTVSGPTGAVTDTVTLSNTGDTILRYTKQNGPPSILQISAVPEPATWGMMILGFGAVGFAMRRRNVTNKVKFA